jgi:capsular exopolysaccharide synthesis family protein
MAKVYDALRRAEEERRKLSDPAAQAVARLDWEPEVAPEAAAPRAPKASRALWFRRLWLKRVTEEGAADFNKRRISLLQPESYVAEQFRALRGRIDAVETPERRIRTLAITSALPGEGKTTASINLALVTALSVGRRVLLIDCDLRRPRVHSALGLRPKAGLAEVLNGDVTFEEAVVRAEGADLDVLAVRDRPVNPSELLGSPSMRDLIVAVGKRYDRVILDTPAALGLPDAKAVGDQCDGLVMVVRADKTRQEDVQSVVEILGRSRVIGVVLNGTSIDQSRYGYQS